MPTAQDDAGLESESTAGTRSGSVLLVSISRDGTASLAAEEVAAGDVDADQVGELLVRFDPAFAGVAGRPEGGESFFHVVTGDACHQEHPGPFPDPGRVDERQPGQPAGVVPEPVLGHERPQPMPGHIQPEQRDDDPSYGWNRQARRHGGDQHTRGRPGGKVLPGQ